MKKNSWLVSPVVWVLALVALSSSEVRAEKPVTRRGTSVMHYLVRGEFHPTNDPAQVVGSYRLQANEQGHSSKQMLDLRLNGLGEDATVTLTALMGEDTNVVSVTDLVANSEGHARLAYKSKSQGHGGRNPLPEILQPLTDLRALGVDNGATQTVAYTWIADAGKFQYLIKRNLTPEDTNGTAAGSISLIANQNRVKFRLLAGGLGPTNDVHLALNSEVRMTVQTDENGRIEIKEWPVDAPRVLELRSLAIWDAGSNVVLRTSLPR
jgi:hypothetical protein